MTLSGSLDLRLQAYRRANTALLSLIRGERFTSRTAAERRHRAEARLARTRALLADLGDPQRAYLTVHITGTSGKGSAAAAIAAILSAAGYRAGLRTSPYLQVATEKLQIDQALIDAPALERLSREILEIGNRLFPSRETGARLGYAEVWSALAYQWFAEEHVDIAVVEVGAGGRFDATNVIDPIITVVTSVGLDHVVTLGPTIADIAWHKAGIIKPGSVAVVGEVPSEAFTVIAEEARAAGAPILRPPPPSIARFPATAMPGEFQRANARLALGAVHALRAQGVAIPEAAVAAGLSSFRLPGRLEKMPAAGPVDVWIDGAHNPDKIAAVAREATRLGERGSLPVIVLGILQAKDAEAIVRGLCPVASAIVATEPTVIGKRALSAIELAQVVRDCGFSGEILIDPAPASAICEAERLALDAGASVLVTGSMYLAGQIRRRWYPDEEIVLQRTPWPELPASPRLEVP